jgi:hypothetical protein
LYEISKSPDVWILSHAYHNPTNRVVTGNENGCLDMFRLSYGAIYALYGDKYACQENLTDVLVHNLSSDKKGNVHDSCHISYYYS